MTQVILGAGGDIGKLLAKELKNYPGDIRLVSRNPRQINGDDHLMQADLLDPMQVDQALQGAAIAYLLVGLAYDVRIWRKHWPLLIKHVIAACLKHKVKLVFFDNVYIYDQKAVGHMDEHTPISPPSGKGQVRYQVIQALYQASKEKGLELLIARSADFYGPDSKNGILNLLVLNNLLAGKKPIWQSHMDRIHSFTYTPDAARACALLGNTPEAYNQVWHLPTSTEKWTGKDFITYAAGLQGKRPSWFRINRLLLRISGWFNRSLKELIEMQYQNDRDYFFDSSKFNHTFNFTPTSYAEGIKQVLRVE